MEMVYFILSALFTEKVLNFLLTYFIDFIISFFYFIFVWWTRFYGYYRWEMHFCKLSAQVLLVFVRAKYAKYISVEFYEHKTVLDTFGIHVIVVQ